MKHLLLLFTCCATVLLCPQNTPAQQIQPLQESGLYFIKNQGQVIATDGSKRPQVEYVAESGGMKLYFSKQGVSYVFIEKKEKKLKGNRDFSKKQEELKVKTQRLDMQLLGGSANVELVGEHQAYSCNYYIAQCPEGLTGVPAYSKLVYKNVYSNIDLVFYTYEHGIKYDFVVRPGGQPSNIRFKYSGAKDVLLAADGRLQVKTDLGELQEHKPLSYCRNKDGQKDVSSNFTLVDGEVRFNVGQFNPSDTLILDPGISWSTYLGGSGNDGTSDNVAVDSEGNLIIRGETTSTNFPVSTNASQTVYGGTSDAFVIKMTPTGRRLWATYFGGTAYDSERKFGGVAVDKDNNIVIVGSTQSDSSSFPESANAFQRTRKGAADAYVAKFSTSGTLMWATYYGGSLIDYGYGIATDRQGNILICGETYSNDFPVSTGASQTTRGSGSGSDGYIVKFNSSGQRLWGTFYGSNGSNSENLFDIVADHNDRIVVVGMVPAGLTMSTGAFQIVHGGGAFDGLIAQFSTAGSWIWSTFMGSSLLDEPNKVTVDSKNNIILVGVTESTGFPVTSTTAVQPTYRGDWEGFVAKFSTTGTRLWSSFYGGSGADALHGVAVDASDNIYISGYTESTNLTVTADALKKTLSGSSDAFILKLDKDCKRLWCSYFGGSSNEVGSAIGLDSFGAIILAGYTQSTNLTVTANAIQTTYGGGDDAFITRITDCSAAPPQVSPQLPINYCAVGHSVILDAGEFSSYLWSTGETTRFITVTTDGGYWVTVWNNMGCPTTSKVVSIDVP